MSDPAIVATIKKLLAFTKKGSGAGVGEAATAAARAQALIEKYKIDRALLEEEAAPDAPPLTNPAESIVYQCKGVNVPSWVYDLVRGLARLNGVHTFYTSGWGSTPGKITGTGREDDLGNVAYMAAYLVGEVERLTAEGLKARKDVETSSRTWANNFRLGAVATIHDRLKKAREAARRGAVEAATNPEAARARAYEEARLEAEAGDPSALLELDRKAGEPLQAFPLAKVNSALARIDECFEISKKHAEEKHQIRTVSRRRTLAVDGYLAGKRAGHRVNLSTTNKRLGGGA